MKPTNMSNDDWRSVDELAHSTIMLSISDMLLFNVENENTTCDMWRKMEDSYAQQSVASKVY